MMKKQFVLAVSLFITTIASAQDSLRSTSINLNTIEELKLYGTLWQQSAAEYRALCYQAYNTAKAHIDAISKKQFRKNHIAIITDLDETVLDNSYLEAQLMKESKTWNPLDWFKWTSQSKAAAVPGAVEFFQYAKQKGATIFYISNRSVGEVASTFINLKKLNLPDADTSHMLFLSNTSSKEIRRQKVMSNYKVVMLLGDNLNDFMQTFEKKNIADRFAETDKVKDDWGKKFIVLPNPVYGEWENAFYNYQNNLTPEQKLNVLRALLKAEDAVQ